MPHYGDHRAVPEYRPDRYDVTAEGPGRWVTLEAPLGRPVAIIYTNDRDVLGYRLAPMEDNPGAAAMGTVLTDAFLGAKAADTPVTVVFDYWAGLASQSWGAGPVAKGDLGEMPQHPRQPRG